MGAEGAAAQHVLFSSYLFPVDRERHGVFAFFAFGLLNVCVHRALQGGCREEDLVRFFSLSAVRVREKLARAGRVLVGVGEGLEQSAHAGLEERT